MSRKETERKIKKFSHKIFQLKRKQGNEPNINSYHMKVCYKIGRYGKERKG